MSASNTRRIAKNSKSTGSTIIDNIKSITNKYDKKNKKDNNNTTLSIVCSLIIIILICIAIKHYAFKNGLLTCDDYVLNTYLYIVLSIFIIYLMVLINDKSGIFDIMLYNSSLLIMLLILIVFIFLIYTLYKIPPQDIFKSNFVWLLLIILLGMCIIPVIEFGRQFGVLDNAAIYTCVIVIIIGLLGYYKGDYIVRFDWDYYLIISLIALFIIIIIGIICIIVYKPQLETFIKFIYIISIISLIIFMLLLLSDHKKLKENADKCINGKGAVIPNYPTQSFTIIIKMYNIFTDLIHILGLRKILKLGRKR